MYFLLRGHSLIFRGVLGYQVWIFDGYTFYTIWSNYNDRKHDQKLEMVVYIREISLFQGNLGW